MDNVAHDAHADGEFSAHEDRSNDRANTVGGLPAMVDTFEEEFNDYLDEGSYAFDGTIEMTPGMTAGQLQERIDDWDFQTMDLRVVLFRDIEDPYSRGIPKKGSVYFLRDGVYGDVKYRFNRDLGVWIPAKARAFAAEDDEPGELYATFRKDDEGHILPEIERPYFRIHSGFSYEELMDKHALTDDAVQARKGVFGIWSRTTGWVLPVTDNSVLLFRAYAEGLSNYLDVYWGDSWRNDRARYPMYFRNDPNDEPAILEDIAHGEAELSQLVTFGLDPTQSGMDHDPSTNERSV